MAEATVSDKFAQVRGFKVEITGARGTEADGAWETMASGELLVISNARTNSPGHKSVNTITLTGYMTKSRKAMCQWIQDTVDGKDWRRTVTITVDYGDGTPPVAVNFEDCYPVRYEGPRFEAGAELVEELRFTYQRSSESPAR